jgi:hypothetical protein
MSRRYSVRDQYGRRIGTLEERDEAEEIVGCILGLIIAIAITTLVAAFYSGRNVSQAGSPVALLSLDGIIFVIALVVMAIFVPDDPRTLLVMLGYAGVFGLGWVVDRAASSA